jgi:phosphate transport system substrate-binding protein
MTRRQMLFRRTAAFALATCLAAALAAAPVPAAAGTLRETGSTLLYPLFERWIPAYDAAHPGTTLTAGATGSGAGITQAIAGHVQIGASDAYMSDQQAEHNPQIVNIPLAISAQVVATNLPGLKGAALKLDGPVLAAIYGGKIRSWDAPAIAVMNPGVALPHLAIVPVRRADASGDTFIFTQFLDFSTQSWEDAVGYGTTVAWPAVAGMRTATGNEGMVTAIAATPGAIGYVGVSFRNAIARADLGVALLKNQAGRFLLPTAATVSAAAAQLDPRTPPDERLSLVFAPGTDSYPLINYEYAVVSIRQPDAATAAAVRQFLAWAVAVTGGNAPAYLAPVGFIPLPDFIRALSESQIDRID